MALEHLLADEGAGYEAPAFLPRAPWAAVDVGLLRNNSRRLEARSYLSDGFGRRMLIESQPEGWKKLGEYAKIWQPGRLKGVVVRKGAGFPFLSAGQVFESAPTVRKWLAKSLVSQPSSRMVERDWLLLSCSGDVGRVTAVYPAAEGVIVTHDLLRIEPSHPDDFAWIYAYLRTETFKEIARTSQYGHMIKHLEPEHVQDMPIVQPTGADRERVTTLVTNLLNKRREAIRLRAVAESKYLALVDPPSGAPEAGFYSVVSTATLLNSRRRLDASYASVEVLDALAALQKSTCLRLDSIEDVTQSVSFGSRFKRFFGENGSPYRSAAELFDVNAPVTKRIYSALVDNPDDYILRKGWIVMACSGQVYGLNGRARFIGNNQDGVFGSHDLIRIIVDESKIHAGYVLTALTHPTLGRPIVMRNAYGTSIPHLDPADIRTIRIPRFDNVIEDEIGQLAKEAADLEDEAIGLEDEATAIAERSIATLVKRS